MKIVRFESARGTVHTGVLEEDDTTKARLIEGGIAESIIVTDTVMEIERLVVPVAAPNIFALGYNYKKHAEEDAQEYPDIPEVFMKATTSLTGPGMEIILPKAGATEVDYEGELAVIIGKRAKNVKPEEAEDFIFGYSCANDVSARDWQWKKQKMQWIRGKSFDTFCPIGPWIVTKDEISDPGVLRIQTTVNGIIMQNASTSDMIFNVFEIVSNLSQSLTLLPGTVILTGTPGGVGYSRIPAVFLKEKDVVEVSIERVGVLSNTVIAE
ncbi:MAG: fumarylacetoacetate hydrolase family protein [Syntrophales bacterium]|jgi:2-keto-4-pentenoate hydratase/2-oxohepta-3-ene-1,7-dioic acid hydratase in catechol pathway|nr:fumarylacetoacetate hydrolase family protein [Syntrophales bacterium]MDY0045521.1 fumarylacetoacetate hydrolase family protein [Syntrophales bacterium]